MRIQWQQYTDDPMPIDYLRELIVKDGTVSIDEVDAVFGQIGAAGLTQSQLIRALTA